MLRAAGVALETIADAYTFDLGGLRSIRCTRCRRRSAPRGSGADWRLVQFKGPVKPEWLARLQADGALPAQYIHPFGYVVWSDAASLSRATAGDGIRWAGEFQTAFRVQPGQRAFGPQRRPTMALVSRHRDAADMTSEIEALGVQVESYTAVDRHFAVVHLDAPGDRYLDLAAIAGVYTVQDSPATGGARGEMSNQSIVGAHAAAPPYTVVPGYRTWLDALGHEGSGVVASVVDGGIRTTHADLASRMLPCVSAGGSPTSCSTSNNSHGTHVAGAIAGTGTTGILLNGFLRGQGVAPGANLVQQRYNAFLGSGAGSMIANGMLTIFRESSLSNAVLTNNSWGPTSTPQGYDIPTQQIDIVARDANPDAGQPATAQRLVDHERQRRTPDRHLRAVVARLAGRSEEPVRGRLDQPAVQRRRTGREPLQRVVELGPRQRLRRSSYPHRRPGCNTDATSSGSDTAFGFNCGTSMASPVVTGASSVFISKYRSEHAGATPSPALVKAAFTAVARISPGSTMPMAASWAIARPLPGLWPPRSRRGRQPGRSGALFRPVRGVHRGR